MHRTYTQLQAILRSVVTVKNVGNQQQMIHKIKLFFILSGDECFAGIMLIACMANILNIMRSRH